MPNNQVYFRYTRRNYPAHDGLWRAWGKETEKGCLALLVIVVLVLVALAGCAAEIS